jgi:hypothetical protein
MIISRSFVILNGYCCDIGCEKFGEAAAVMATIEADYTHGKEHHEDRGDSQAQKTGE